MAIILSVLPIGIPGRTEARASTASLMTCRRAQRQRRWHRRLLHPMSPPRQLWRPSREGGIRGVVGVGMGYRRTWRRRIHPTSWQGEIAICKAGGTSPSRNQQCVVALEAPSRVPSWKGCVLFAMATCFTAYVAMLMDGMGTDRFQGQHRHADGDKMIPARAPPVLGYLMRNFNDHPQSSSSLPRWLGPMLGLFLARPGNAP